jgi:hypothetical protein
MILVYLLAIYGAIDLLSEAIAAVKRIEQRRAKPSNATAMLKQTNGSANPIVRTQHNSTNSTRTQEAGASLEEILAASMKRAK